MEGGREGGREGRRKREGGREDGRGREGRGKERRGIREREGGIFGASLHCSSTKKQSLRKRKEVYHYRAHHQLQLVRSITMTSSPPTQATHETTHTFESFWSVHMSHLGFQAKVSGLRPR